MTTVEKTSKDKYEEALTLSLHKGDAKTVAEKVLNTLMAGKISNSYSELTKQIGEATAKGDIDLIIKLSNDLKNVKDNRTAHEKTFTELRKKYDFSDVMQAFKGEFEAVAYDATWTALVEAHRLMSQGGKGSKTAASKPETGDTRPTTTYEITKGDKTVIFPIRAGRSKLSMDTDVFAFLGFQVVIDEDKKEALEPGTVKQKDGSEIPATRKAIALAIKDKLEGFEGYEIKEITAGQ